jgi:hypothetical protein
MYKGKSRTQKTNEELVIVLLILFLKYAKKPIENVTAHIPYSVENTLAIFLDCEFNTVKSLIACASGE